MSDTKGNIRARKLGNTGITEDILKKIADAKGGHVLAILELKAETIHEQIDGDDRTVDFIITTIEPVIDGKLDGRLVDHVRDIQAALYRNRKLAEGGDQQLDFEGDGPEPTVKDVLEHGKAFIEHDEDGAGLWDGNTDEPADDEDQEARTDLQIEDWVNSQHGEEPEEPDADDPAYDPHPYVDTAHATCGYKGCGQPAGAAIHTTADQPEPVA